MLSHNGASPSSHILSFASTKESDILSHISDTLSLNDSDVFHRSMIPPAISAIAPVATATGALIPDIAVFKVVNAPFSPPPPVIFFMTSDIDLESPFPSSASDNFDITEIIGAIIFDNPAIAPIPSNPAIIPSFLPPADAAVNAFDTPFFIWLITSPQSAFAKNSRNISIIPATIVPIVVPMSPRSISENIPLNPDANDLPTSPQSRLVTNPRRVSHAIMNLFPINRPSSNQSTSSKSPLIPVAIFVPRFIQSIPSIN